MGSGEAARRRHILAVAERLLCRYGPAKTTVAEIAREADIGVGTVYLEFPSKEAILEALSNGRHAAVLDAMRAAAAGDRPAADRLRAALDARTRAFLDVGEAGAHARDLVHCVNPAIKSAHARFQDEELALLADLLRTGAASGELAVVDPDAAAQALLRAYASFAPPWVFGQDADQLRRSLDAMHALVLDGLRSRS